jgi:protein ImuB
MAEKTSRASAPPTLDLRRPLRDLQRRRLPRPQLAPRAPQAAPEAAELWLAVHLPALPFDAVAAGEAAGARPLAVVELVQRVQRVVAVSAAARERGVAPGLALAAALALEPRLETRARDPRAERRLLARLAREGFAFTPRVSLEPPDGVLLEVRGSLALFGGVEALSAAIEAAGARMGARVQLALAPTPLAALAAARAERAWRGANAVPFRVTSAAALVGALAPLPLAALRLPQDVIERLAKVGVRTLGEALRLPRAGFSRRFGAAALTTLDRCVGRAPDPRRPFVLRERFRARCEPAHELTTTAAVEAQLAPVLAELEAFLRERQCGITSLALALRHRAGASTRGVLRFASPAFEARAIARLLGERLAVLPLPAPVTAFEIGTSLLGPRALASESLWQPGEHGGGAGGETSALLERLRTRLGEESVYGLCLVPDHRPEAAWRVAEPGLGARSARATRAARTPPRGAAPASGGNAPVRRPLWLLATPQALAAAGGWPQCEGALERLAGPERLETGWWDGRDIARDYYVMRNAAGVQLWVYREREPPHPWFLHGVFG